MPRTLSRIPKLHGTLVPAAHWKMAGAVPPSGSNPGGQQLYTESIPRHRAVPDYEQVECKGCFGERQEEPCQECNGTGTVDGEQRWKVNPLNGERLYKINKPEFYTQQRMFYIQSDGQGNQYKVDWAPPTPEQIEAIRHDKAVADMVPALASALVDRGLSVDEIVSRLTADTAAPKPALVPEGPVPAAGAPEPVATHAPEEVADTVPAVDPDADEEL